MPLFEYKAVAPTGETVQGTMEAASVDAVVLKLQEAGNVPLQARESGGGFSLGGFSIGRRSMNPREVAEFTQQLATLLGAGLPLDRSLQVLLELAESDRVKRAMSEIRDKVREGGSLSDALDGQHGAFNRLFINMVRAGEAGGVLDRILVRLASFREKAAEKVYSELGRFKGLKAEKPDLKIGVAGCVAQAEGEEIMRRQPMVDLVVGPQSYHRLPELEAKAGGKLTVFATDERYVEGNDPHASPKPRVGRLRVG